MINTKKLGIGMIGTGFMGKAHTLAYKTASVCFEDIGAIPELKIIASQRAERAEKACQKFGFQRWTTDWQDVTNDPEVDIVDICTPNYLHKEMAVAAAKAGKHIMCEKPLGLNGIEAKEIYDVIMNSGVKCLVCYNYRKVPAVAQAKKMIDEGQLGEIYHFRGSYLQDWLLNYDKNFSWKLSSQTSGAGTLGDIGSHIIDISRYLIGEPIEVCGKHRTIIKKRIDQKTKSLCDVDVDDAGSFLMRFEEGITAAIEATRFANGHKNHLSFEVNGSKGSVRFNYERMNELEYYSSEDPAGSQGFRTILTGPKHPNGASLWPIPGINIGYTEIKAIEVYDLIQAIIKGTDVSPSVYDGLRANQIVDAILSSGEKNCWITI